MPRSISAEALLSAIVSSTDDAIVAVDHAGTVVTWNPAAEALYGHAAAEAIGTSVGELMADGDIWQSALVDVFAGERRAHQTAVRIRGDGTSVTVGETLSPVRTGDGRVIAVASIAHDVGERIASEHALKAARRELEVKNRRLERSNAELEQFAYVASHDLSEPLRAVAGMVGLLARRYQGRLDSDADEFIAFAVDGCERMRTMIEDLLAFSRAGRTDLAPDRVDLRSLVDEVRTSLSSQIDGAGATVTADDLPVVRADRRQLVQVVQNLVSNAVKFAAPDTPPVVHVAAAREGDAWRIEVRDNGIGIEPRYQQRIFRMFQRLHPRDAFPGTGIGLAIAERVVDRHGGRMGVESTGTGSTFWFTIPDVLEQEAL